MDYLRSFAPRLVAMVAGQIVQDGPMGGAARNTPHPIRSAPAPRPESDPLVRVENLYVGYDDRPVLRGVSVEVYPGEFVAVMGDNGSGKTTFLQCLLGLIKPEQGRVQVVGQDTQKASVSGLARQVGFVFQNPDHQIFGDSVWQEAIFALQNFSSLDGTTRTWVGELLTRGGLGDRREDHPYRLSYGEKRRLNLISVLGYAPRLLLVDEILIGQDAGNAAFLLELLREQAEKGNAVILVNHAPEITRRYASRLLFFEGGQVVVDAPTDEGLRRLDSLGHSAYLPSCARAGGQP